MAKKKKTTIRVKRYVYVTKTVVKKPKQDNPTTSTATSTNIGEFAGLTFAVKLKEDGSPKVLSPNDINQNISSNWAEHQIIGRKRPKSEFIGANSRTLSMTITVDYMLGYKPHTILHKLNKFCETGKVGKFKLGTHQIGSEWKITNLSEPFEKIWKNGQLTKASAELELTSYD
ncbi:MAG: phage tail protein [Eubacterium sp.]|nr:phage tail protein [Eubacterium sp.]